MEDQSSKSAYALSGFLFQAIQVFLFIITCSISPGAASAQSVKNNFTEHFPNGNIKTEGALDDQGEKTGVWTEYYKGGEKLSEKEYRNGLFHGKNVTWYRNGNVLAEGEYRNGTPHGRFAEYDEKGRIMEEKYFEDGAMHGTHIIYFTSGEVNEKINYKRGKLHGVLKTYYPNGKLLSQQQYEYDIPVGVFSIYRKNGKLKRRVVMDELNPSYSNDSSD